MNKSILASVLISVTIIVVAFVFVQKKSDQGFVGDGMNVKIENGIQVVEIDARGGYSPKISVAKAGLPTVLRFNTSGTFDCSASVRIPELGVSKLLSSQGSSDIEIGTRNLGTLNGSCGMGMYPFSVNFQ